MMKRECPPPEFLLAALDDGTVHPWSDHVTDCPRCRAVVRARDAFLDDALAAAYPSGDQAAAADRLDAFISGLPLRRRGITHPARWLGLAAVLLVGLGLFSLDPRLETLFPRDRLDTGATGAVRLRGDDTSGPTAWTAPIVTRGESGITITWESYPEADEYRVTCLTPVLTEVLDLSAGAGTEISLDRDDVPAAAREGFVVVVALRGGREIRRTVPVPLP